MTDILSRFPRVVLQPLLQRHFFAFSFFPFSSMTLTSASPLLNPFQKKRRAGESAFFFFPFLFFPLHRPSELQVLKNGRDLELRPAELRSSFSLLLPIRLIPRFKVWDFKFYNRKTEDSSQSFYRRLFLHCSHWEKCFLGGMGLLAAMPPMAAGKNCCAAKRHFFP